MFRLLRFCVGILLFVALSAAGYVLYLNANYTRIDDGVEVPNEGATPPSATIVTGATYTALTYNVGFGAYTPDFSFFMETGTMTDGTLTRGDRGIAARSTRALPRVTTIPCCWRSA